MPDQKQHGQHNLLGFATLTNNKVGMYPRWQMTNECTVSSQMSVLFTDHREYETFLWVVGNAIQDPQSSAAFVLLYGRGGNGKSTLLTMINQVLTGSCGPVDMSSVAINTAPRMPAKTIQQMMSNRILTCGDVDLRHGYINEHYLKVATGGDTVSLAPFSVRLTGTAIVGSNYLPSSNVCAGMSSEAVQRRYMVIPMDVDALTLPPFEFTVNHADHVSWLYRCLHYRLTYTRAPMITRSLLMTVYCREYIIFADYIEYVDNASLVEVLGANLLMCTLTGRDMATVSSMLGYHDRDLLVREGGLWLVKGVRALK
jgi:energy-coupling factor transporter ATP-binding protein EcfA2